jgi:hypothetical protein
MYYDHTTLTWSNAVQIGVNPISPDDHGPPTLAIGLDGSIFAFFGSHSTAQKVYKSNAPEDISAWTAVTDMDAFASYPQPHMRASGTMQVFYRRATSGGGAGLYWSFKTTANSGGTWSAATDVVYFAAGTSIYGIVNYQSDTVIHLAWFKWVEPDLSQRLNVYYAKSVDGGASWTKADGTALTLPIDEAHAELVFNSGTDQAYVWDLKVDSTGKPVIFFNTGVDAAATYKCARWNGSAWVITTISATHWARNLGALDIVSDTIFDAYVTNGTFTGRGGELQRFRSTDAGATWALAESLMSGCTMKAFSPQMVANYDPAVKIVWGTGWQPYSNVAFSGTAAKVVDIAQQSDFRYSTGTYDAASTEQFLSSPRSLKINTSSSVVSKVLTTVPLGSVFEIWEYFSQATARANTLAIYNAGGNLNTAGAMLKMDTGKVYSVNSGGSWVDTGLVYTTGWNRIRIIQRATQFTLMVNAAMATIANRNTLTDISVLHLEADSTFAAYFDDISIRAPR